MNFYIKRYKGIKPLKNPLGVELGLGLGLGLRVRVRAKAWAWARARVRVTDVECNHNQAYLCRYIYVIYMKFLWWWI